MIRTPLLLPLKVVVPRLHACTMIDVDGRIDRLQAEVGGVRSDLTQVALAVGVKPRASNG